MLSLQTSGKQFSDEKRDCPRCLGLKAGDSSVSSHPGEGLAGSLSEAARLWSEKAFLQKRLLPFWPDEWLPVVKEDFSLPLPPQIFPAHLFLFDYSSPMVLSLLETPSGIIVPILTGTTELGGCGLESTSVLRVGLWVVGRGTHAQQGKVTHLRLTSP